MLIGDQGAADRIREYFKQNMEDSIKLFLGICQRHADEGAFKLYNDWINAFYGDQTVFIKAVEEFNPSYGTELVDFLKKVKESAPRDCAPYDFKFLPVT